MSYSNAIYYVDLYNGDDSTRPGLIGATISNPIGTVTRVNYIGHGLVTGAIVLLLNFDIWINGFWKVTVVDPDNFDLDGAVWQATIDVTGDVYPIGGSSWNDSFKTINLAAALPGDELRISKTPDPSLIGFVTWSQGSHIVTVDSASIVQDIDNCEPPFWTDGGGSTYFNISLDSSFYKQGSYSMNLSWNATPVVPSTRLFYRTLPSTLDLSTFDSISFWYKRSDDVASDFFRVKLCSDIAGLTVVDEFIIPEFLSNYSDVWTPLTLTRVGGGNLGASINSVAVYSGLGAGSLPIVGSNINFDNIFACNTGSLNLTSLIGKNNDEGWFGIQYVDGTSVHLSLSTATPLSDYSMSLAIAGYTGESEIVNSYVRQNVFVSSSVVPSGGTVGNPTNYIFGWNTGSNIQDGETFMDMKGQNATFFDFITSSDYVNLISASVCRCDTAIRMDNSNNNNILFGNITDCSLYGIYLTNSDNNSITGSSCSRNSATAVYSLFNNNIQINLKNANETVGPFGGSTFVSSQYVTCSILNTRGILHAPVQLVSVTDSIFSFITCSYTNTITEGLITFVNGSSNNILSCNFMSASAHHGLKLYDSEYNDISLGTIDGTAGNAIIISNSFTVGRNNIVVDTIKNSADRGIFVTLSRENVITASNIQNCTNYSFHSNNSHSNILKIGNIVGGLSSAPYCIYLDSTNNTVVSASSIITDYNPVGIQMITAYNNDVYTGFISGSDPSFKALGFSSAVSNNVDIGALYCDKIISFNNSCYNNSFSFGSASAATPLYQISYSSCEGAKTYIRNSSFDYSKINWGAVSPSNDTKIYSQNHNLTGYDYIFTDDGSIINSLNTTRPNSAGKMWMFQPSSQRNSYFPLEMRAGYVYCNQSVPVLIKAWMKKDHATNITGRLVVKGGQIAGVPRDVSVALQNNTDWQQLSLSFIPTQTGVIEVSVYAEYVSGVSNVYFDQGLTVSI
jgi:parallel beta-helix repeat protein